MNTKNTESLRGPARQFQVHGLTTFKPNHPDVMALRRGGHEPNAFGCRIWRSSYLLIEYLSRQWWPAARHFMELGSGWGLPSSYVQKQFGVRVTAQDLDQSVIPYQQLISRTNHTLVTSCSGGFNELTAVDLQSVNVIMGADICYSAVNTLALAGMLGRFSQSSGGEMILADCGRAPFFQLADSLSQDYALDVYPITIALPTQTKGYVLHLKLPL